MGNSPELEGPANRQRISVCERLDLRDRAQSGPSAPKWPVTPPRPPVDLGEAVRARAAGERSEQEREWSEANQEFVAATGYRTFTSLNPAAEEVIGEASAATISDAGLAIRSLDSLTGA